VLAATPWLTFGANFAVAATLAWGWLRWWLPATGRARTWWVVASAIYAVSFAVALRLILAQQATNPLLHAAVREWDLSAPTAPLLTRAGAAAWRYGEISARYAFLAYWPLAVPLALIGAWRWPRLGRGFLWWLYAGSGAIAVVAALAGRYLLADGRLLLFAVPPLLLAAAAGLAAVAGRAAPAWGAGLTQLVAAVLALVWSGQAITHRLASGDPSPYFVHDVLHDVSALLDLARPLVPAGEPVYVGEFASRPFVYYGRGRFAAATVCLERCDRGAVSDAWRQRLAGRGWMILTADDRGWYAAYLEAHGCAWSDRAASRGASLWSVTCPTPAP
jgi:hypothetical protein